MKLTDDEKKVIVENRIKRAFDTWEETQIIIEAKLWHSASNRMYYACYYIVSALLTSKGYNATTHAGIIRLFGQHFIATGIFESNIGKFYSKLFELRQSGDYDDWKIISEDDILPLVNDARSFLEAIKREIEKG